MLRLLAKCGIFSQFNVSSFILSGNQLRNWTAFDSMEVRSTAKLMMRFINVWCFDVEHRFVLATDAFLQHGFNGVKRCNLPRESRRSSFFCGLASSVRYRPSTKLERSGIP